jgi:hypothetical protein
MVYRGGYLKRFFYFIFFAGASFICVTSDASETDCELPPLITPVSQVAAATCVANPIAVSRASEHFDQSK